MAAEKIEESRECDGSVENEAEDDCQGVKAQIAEGGEAGVGNRRGDDGEDADGCKSEDEASHFHDDFEGGLEKARQRALVGIGDPSYEVAEEEAEEYDLQDIRLSHSGKEIRRNEVDEKPLHGLER